ncbi:hypothetical protein [Nocardia sp. N2S4-5]|uniref:hypothetical protein n=1 Tax=Nocardia sp. N2S4-5 TaxID=3351565 RepID=UPI0037D97B34
MTHYDNPYRLFLPQSTPSKHRVFAITRDLEHGWDQLTAIASFNNRWEAVRLADALNELLAGAGLAEEFLTEALHDAPGPVRSEVQRVAEALRTETIETENPYLDALVRPSICGVMRFPLGPETQVAPATAADEDEDAAYDDYWGWITPRTAETLRTAGVVLSDDVVHDDLGGDRCLPDQLQGQGKQFRRRFAKRVDALVDDLRRGESPRPRCIAEEIALWMMLDDAEGMIGEPEIAPAGIEDLPASAHDFSFDDLRELLYQDHDFHYYFEPIGKETPLSTPITELFEPFLNPPPRNARRPSSTGLGS